MVTAQTKISSSTTALTSSVEPKTPPRIDLISKVRELSIEYNQDPTLVLKIMECESGLDPYAINKNSNGTQDLGLWQINTVHEAEAEMLGLDITNVNDNIKYGFILLLREGTKPWNASKSCWDK